MILHKNIMYAVWKHLFINGELHTRLLSCNFHLSVRNCDRLITTDLGEWSKFTMSGWGVCDCFSVLQLHQLLSAVDWGRNAILRLGSLSPEDSRIPLSSHRCPLCSVIVPSTAVDLSDRLACQWCSASYEVPLVRLGRRTVAQEEHAF